ncbi:hypothetical protein MVEG_01131 [Podila verticillata NRRL 6337]|nr:MAG: hypothetical protein BYD32DRAFT_405871 [Podila humilis]KFH73918.1 hypothetical protein MVEG_01131 [Podila verticillata NRRL 6337]
MSHLTPASILAAMDSTCSPSEMMAYNSHHHHHHHSYHHHHHHDSGMASFDDSDSDSSSCSGSSSSSFSTSSLSMQDNLLHHSVSVAPAVMHVSNGSIAHNVNMNNNISHMNHNMNNNINNVVVNPNPAPSGPITYHYFCNFPTCGYHSARSDPVKRHRDTHYPDYKPYICNYCQSSSARRDSTREHCLKQHKDDSENAFRYDTMIPKPEGWIAYEPKRSPWPPLLA